jgi:hypothetical protein
MNTVPTGFFRSYQAAILFQKYLLITTRKQSMILSPSMISLMLPENTKHAQKYWSAARKAKVSIIIYNLNDVMNLHQANLTITIFNLQKGSGAHKCCQNCSRIQS